MFGAIGPLHIIAFSAFSALVAELISWALVYRTPDFKALNSNISKHTSQVDAAKEGGTGPNAIKKKEARLQSLRDETAKHVAAVNFKTGVVTMVMLLLNMNLMGRLFAGTAVARLPFEPPSLLQKLTHRGLTDADPRECSAMFIYVLCQGSFKLLASKLTNWGPSRAFAEISPTLPKMD